MNAITIKEYFADEGSPFSNKDARVIGPVLERLAGGTRSEVLDAARPMLSPLHKYFEWNDSIAGELYRRDQAGRMLRAIKIKYADETGLHIARAFHIQHVGSHNNRTPSKFRSFQVLHGESAFAAQMMQSAMDDLQSWRRKYEPYVPIWDNFSAAFAAVLNQISECESEVVHPNLPAFTDDAISALIDWRLRFIEAALTWDAWVEQMKFLIESIKDAERVFCDASAIHHRDCIKCGKSFLSVDPGHRMCRKCANTKTVNELTVVNARIG